MKTKAVIGAHTSIRNSFIDEGAMIGDGARIFGSVIGKGAFVATNSIVFGSVVYPEAFAAQHIVQASILGRRSCVLAASYFFDVNFFRNIRVAHRGKLMDSGSQFLGVCVGPNTRVGAGVWVGSGREIPSGALLVRQTGDVATRIGDGRARRALHGARRRAREAHRRVTGAMRGSRYRNGTWGGASAW